MKKVAVIVIVALVIIGGGAVLYANKNNLYGNSPSPSMSNMPMQSTSASTPSTPQATNTVKIENFAFSPAAITVKKGTTVTWTNKDSAAHTVTETDGQAGPKSGDLSTGQSYSFTFNTVGTFKYDCSIHTYMTGTVTVTA